MIMVPNVTKYIYRLDMILEMLLYVCHLKMLSSWIKLFLLHKSRASEWVERHGWDCQLEAKGSQSDSTCQTRIFQWKRLLKYMSSRFSRIDSSHNKTFMNFCSSVGTNTTWSKTCLRCCRLETEAMISHGSFVRQQNTDANFL